MTTTTELTDLTNGSVVNGEWAGTGVFDMLIAAVNKNIEIQYQKGRITGSDYADVYLGGVQAVLQQSVQWVLQVDTSDAQVDDIRKGIELKEAQLKIAYTEQVIKDKQAAVLGLDNVVKNKEAERLANPAAIYTPQYEVI
jgi:hypothetical protein